MFDCRFLLEKKLYSAADTLVDVMREDKIRLEIAGAIALYELYLGKYEGRTNKALDRLRSLQAAHEIESVVFDKVLQHATGTSETFTVVN